MDASFEPIPMLDPTTEVDELWNDLQVAIGRVLRSGRFVLGPEVDAFEREAAAYLGVRHAVGLDSGTDALVIGLRAMGIGAGDDVITSAYSFFATAESIAVAGATPVFADIRLDTLNLIRTRSRPQSPRAPGRSSRCICSAAPRRWTGSWRSPRRMG